MASPQELATLHSMALDEQYSAALEQRELDWRLLDKLAKTVLSLESPVVCESPIMYYQDHKPEEGRHVVYEIESLGIVGGRFGGFTNLELVEVTPDNEQIKHQEAGYYILDSNRNDTGCICPVQASRLYDSVAALGNEDPVFDEITYLLGQAKIDIRAVAKLIDNIPLDDPRLVHYATYIKTMVKPSDLFSWVMTDGLYMLLDNGDYGDGKFEDTSAVQITQADTFTLFETTGSKHELVLRRNPRSNLVIPINYIVGYEWVS
jgi:hypothetical protein